MSHKCLDISVELQKQLGLKAAALLKYSGKSKSVETNIAPRAAHDVAGCYSISLTKRSRQRLRISEKEQPLLTAQAPKPPARSKSIIRSNSTSSIYHLANTVPHAPTASVLVNCLARAVFYDIKNSGIGRDEPIFHQAGEDYVPDMKQVEYFLAKIFYMQELPAECAVMVAAFLDQLRICADIKLNKRNWQRILLICLLEADKTLRDNTIWNEDYFGILDMDIYELHRIERAFLMLIQFNLILKPSDYAKYYFDLISLREKTEENFPQIPLDRQKAIEIARQTQYKAEVSVMGRKSITIQEFCAIQKDYEEEIYFERSRTSPNLPTRLDYNLASLVEKIK